MERTVVPDDGRVVIDLDEVDEVHVRLVGGEVSVGGTETPPRLEVECLRGEPVVVSLDRGVLLVEHDNGSPLRMRNTAASIALTVPPCAPVNVRTVSASVLTAGLAADTAVKTVSGAVTATYLSGSVALGSVSGEIEVEAVSGRLKATSVSGGLTVNAGSVSELAAKSMSGDIVVDLDVKPSGRYECRSTSGDIALRLAAGAPVGVEARSISGRLDDAYSEPAGSGRTRRRSLSVESGDEHAARFRLETVSGDIALFRRAAALPAAGFTEVAS